MSIKPRLFRRFAVIVAVLAVAVLGLARWANSDTDFAIPRDPTVSNEIKWSRIADTPAKGLEATGGTIDGKLYSFGGYYDDKWYATNNAYVYDSTTNKWSNLPKVPRPMTHVGTVVDDRRFILAGGNSADDRNYRIEAIDNVYAFDVDTNKWSNLPSLPSARAGGGLALVDRTLHYFGGVNIARQEQPTHWTLNLEDLGAGWQDAGTFPYNRTHFSTTSIGDQVYVIGGLIGINKDSKDFADGYRYDTKTGTWTQIADLPKPLSHTTDASIVHDGKIWLFGGEIAYNVIQSSVYIYDPATNSWSGNTSLPAKRMAGIGGVINDEIYYTQGTMESKKAWKATFVSPNDNTTTSRF